MKTILIAALLPTTLAIATPVLAPKDCRNTIQPTEKISNYYTNKDCTTVYVAPPDVGKTWVTAVRPNAALLKCREYQTHLEAIKTYRQHIQTLNAHQFELLLDGALTTEITEAIQRQVSAIYEQIKTIESNWKRQLGMTLTVVFDASLGNNGLNEFIRLNPGVRVVKMPIANSSISYQPIMASTAYESLDNPDVIGTTIPGVSLPGHDAVDQVRFNSAITGEIDLSLWGACPLIESPTHFQDLQRIADNPYLIRQTFAANYNYTIPVEVAFGYKARLGVNRAITKILHRLQRRHQFSASDISREINNGRDIQAFEIEIDTQGLTGLSAEELAQFKMELKNEVQERLSQQLLDKLEKTGLIGLADIESLQAPAPGTVDRTGYRNHCWNDWGVFGIRKTRRCKRKSYRYKVPVEGRANQLIEQHDLRHFVLTEELRANSLVHIPHSGTFEMMGGVQ